MKKYIYLLLIVFLFFICPRDINAIVNPTERFYINDYAGILSEETENYIFQKSVALNNADGTQIVVVTVPNLGKDSLEEYANELFRSFGIGDSKKNNGLLLLLALEEREFRVEVGDGLGGILPDGKTGRFQDQYIIPYLRDNLWDEGIKNGYDAFYSEIVTNNNLDIGYNEPVEMENEDFSFDILWSIYVSAMIGIVFGYYFKINEKKHKHGTKIYLIVWVILFVISMTVYKLLCILLMFNLPLFLVSRYSTSYGQFSNGRYRSGGSSSGGSFSGGGGFSSGGGSSRNF